jgi:hypothetical protein
MIQRILPNNGVVSVWTGKRFVFDYQTVNQTDINEFEISNSRRHWRVVWNPKKFNIREALLLGQNHGYEVEQSKGKAVMVTVPTKGDTVTIVSKGLAIMRGEVLRGFTNTRAHQQDTLNIGQASHREPEYSSLLSLTTINPVRVRFAGMSTWVSKYTFDELIDL